MKKWFILIGIFLVLLIGGYFVLTFYAVKFIQPRLQPVMGAGFTLEGIKLKTTYLSARGIQYEDPRSKQRFFQVEELRIYPSLLSLLKKSLHIKELTVLRPSFFFYRSREEVKKKSEEAVEVQIDRIRIQKGSIDFEDRKIGDPSSQMKLRDLDFEIRDIRYPLVSLHSPVELKGKMKGKAQEGSITLKGWIDAKTMDMEIFLKIREIEVKTFEPYYRKRVTAEIESGTLDMDSRIAVKEKRMDAPGELDLINFHIKEGGGAVFWIPAETLIPLLERRKYEIKVPFQVKGNLEDPKFNLQETFLMRIAFSLAEALGLPVKSVAESLFGEPEKGMEGLRSLEELFKKKKEKKR
jgi:hypothetical protein